MSVILLDKNKFNNLLKEAPVSGDKAALNVAKAQGSLKKAKDRLQSIGIYEIPGLKNINTLDQLAIEPFKFSFLLQIPDNPQGLSLPNPHPFKTLARVIEKKPLTLEVKTDGGLLFKMIFPKEEELITQLPGTKEPIIGKSNKVMALVSEGDGEKGKFYSIEFDHAKELVDESKENEKNKKEEEGEEGEGEEGEDGENNNGKVKQLFNDLAGFFKFTYNNRRLAAPNLFPKEKPKNTVESYINQIANNTILIKEDEGTDPNKMKPGVDHIGKIYIQSITLGPKASARAGEEREDYANKVKKSKGGQSAWDGNLKNLTTDPIEVSNVYLKITDTSADPMDVKEVENELNGSQYKNNATIRKSQNFSTNNTIVIGLKNNKAVVCKIPRGVFNLKDLNDVELSKKPLRNDSFGKPVKAQLQITL